MTNITAIKEIKLGTRGSPLAMAQAREVRDRLQQSHAGLVVEIVKIKVMGDQILDRALSAIGGKGLFVKELDEAQLAGRIDIGVHSMKDLETQIAEGLAIGAILPREDERDAFISRKYACLEDMPPGSILGTSSLRRQAIILEKRPDLKVVTFRGNVQTRLKKLDQRIADATLLAVAGLNRLGCAAEITEVLDTAFMLPAVAQGAIAVSCRETDQQILNLLQPLMDRKTCDRVTAERAMLAELDGSCRTPVAGLAEILPKGSLRLRGYVARPDGKNSVSIQMEGAANEATSLGRRVGRALRSRMGDDFFNLEEE